MGLLIFRSLEDAQRNGFIPYDRLPMGEYLVRKMISERWQMAIVDAPDSTPPALADPDDEC